MTDYATLDAAASGENAAVISVAQDAVRAQPLALNGLYYDATRGQIVDVVDRIQQELRRLPRKQGRYTVTDAPSFVGYLNKHVLTETELWANINTGTVRAVLNAHKGSTGTAPHNSVDTSQAEGVYEIPNPGDAGHEDHTVTLQLATTDDWKQWTAYDGKLVPQLAFAEFIEDHLPNFQTPTAADMLELAQTFQASSKGEFASSKRVKSGETALTWSEQHEAKAGAKGQIAIPDTFTIALQPFENGAAYKVEARFRYRIHDGALTLGYRLTRPQDVRKAAFDDVVAFIAADTGRAIWATP